MRQFKIFIMLSKSKLYISVLILAISLGLMPIGPLINGYIRDQVSAEIPDTLLKIKGDVVPEIETYYIGLGVPEVLEGVREKLISEISDDIVKVEAIPKTLLILQNRTIDILPLIINCSGTANLVYDVMENVTIYNVTSYNAARNQFFNNINFNADYATHFNSSIEGVSEHMTGGTQSLNYSDNTRYRLLYGYPFEGRNYPGILIDHTLFQKGEIGIGLIDWLELFYEAVVDNASRTVMENVYECSWDSLQIQLFAAYIITYIWPDFIKKQYEPLDIDTYADLMFYRQWANKTDYPEGLPLEYIVSELEDKLKSAAAVDVFEVAFNRLLTRPAINNNLTLAREIFFNNCNMTGIYNTEIQGVSEYKYQPTVCNATYSLNYTSTAQWRLLDGYGDYPGIFQQPATGIGLVQWINLYNGAINPLVNDTMQTVYNATWIQLEAFADHLDYIYEDFVEVVTQKGLEVNIPYQYTPPGTNTTLFLRFGENTARDLWDPSNPYSIVNESGIKKWFDAYKGDITAQNELNATFDLNEFLIYNTTHSRLYSWLFTTIRLQLVPIFFTFLDYQGENITPIVYAGTLSLWQWANGTLDSTGFDLGGGIKGFEVGVPTPSNISYSMTTSLFDEANNSAFVHGDGILKWIEAYEGNPTVQGELRNIFQLNNTQLNMITNWLFTIFKPDVVPNLVEEVTVDPHKCNPYYGYCGSYTLTELAVLAFYRQWSNGSLSRQLRWNGGLDPVWLNQTGLDSIAGWEAGFPQSLGIDEDTVERLWVPTTIWEYYRPLYPNPLAIITPTGFPLWYKAITVSSTYEYLKNAFGLTNDQMDGILDSIVFIGDNFALDILQEESGSPMNHYELAELYFMSFIITSSVLVAISALLVVWVILSKRK
ncbi:MAG: hypothetical protein ACFE8L_09795 [Candidatus Hodarchaeota archaeon]